MKNDACSHEKLSFAAKFTLTTGAEWGMIVMLVKQINFT